MLNAIPSFNLSDSIVFVNQRVPAERTAFQYTNENGWHNKLIKEIVTGKKVVIFWGSQKKGVEFEQYLKENHDNVLVKFYHSKGNNTEMSADLENVRNAWKDVQVLMYTSKITVGVNFDEMNIFDSIFVYGTSSGCSARDVIQATMRVRHLRENSLHYYTSGFVDQSRYVDLDMLKSRMAAKNEILDKLDRELVLLMPEKQIMTHELHIRWKTEEHWMVHLYLQNSLEEKESNLTFNKVFERFLQTCGYRIEHVIEYDKASLKKCIGLKYENIPLLDKEILALKLLNPNEQTNTEKS